MWIVKFAGKEVQKPTLVAAKNYMHMLVLEVNTWEAKAGQSRTTVDFQDTDKQSIILLDGKPSGSIYEDCS